MQKMKRNHWVTQAYLRTFAADAERREKIWRFGKNEGDPELKPIEKVAVRFYLYAPATADGTRDYSFEQKLSDLEQWFGNPLWFNVCNEMVPLQWEPLRKMVSLLAAVMFLRNPAQLERTKSIHRKIVDAYSRLPEVPSTLEHKGKVYKLDIRKWPEYRNASEDDLKRHWISEISSAGWLATRFLKMRWAVVFSETPVFITTDHPVTIVHPSMRYRGLDHPETIVYFPLSPTRMLVMDNRHSEPDANYYPLKADPGSFNFILWHNAAEYMFSHRHPDLVCSEMLQEAEKLGFA
jgi:hypothetical protein